MSGPMHGNEGRLRWFVVQTQPHSEKRTTAHLARQGFRCYLPRFLKCRCHSRKTDIVSAHLFPRYMFVAIDETQQWRPIHSTVDVARLVCRGDEPEPVPDGVIDELRARGGEDGFIKLDDRPTFTPGAKVEVRDGAFAGSHALYSDMIDSDRVAILLDRLGRKVRTVIDWGAIIAV